MRISRKAFKDLVEAVEDAVAYSLDESRKDGELISGECAANAIACYYLAKVAEFEGVVLPDAKKYSK